jgi:hypothetical protein
MGESNGGREEMINFEDEIIITLLKKYDEELKIRPHERGAITDKYACMITCYILGQKNDN